MYKESRRKSNSRLARLPEIFASRQANRYSTGVDLLAGYTFSKQLVFIADCLAAHRDLNGQWNMGAGCER